MRVARRQVTTEATEVRKGPIPDSVFVVPVRLQEDRLTVRRGPAAAPTPLALKPLVTTEWLAAELGAPDLRVADVRWYLDPARRGRDAYAAGHIPGAVFLDMDTDLSAPGGGRGRAAGRHPWPAKEQVAARHERGRHRARRRASWPTTTRRAPWPRVCGTSCARYGHDAVAVLDGGLRQVDGGGTSAGDGVRRVRRAAAFAARPRAGMGPRQGGHGARGPAVRSSSTRVPAQRYRGESDPIDPRAGHIPGALQRALQRTTSPADPLPVFRTPAELRARYEALGRGSREPPIVYCGSGVTACHDLLALELAGLRGRLYAGSWSEWSADAQLPVATGSDRP